ncbi:MAG: VOC family protein [Nitrososphaerales archaeon]
MSSIGTSLRSEFYTKYANGEEMDHLAFGVGDAIRAYKELRKKGVRVAIPPSKSKGTEIYIKDPNGIWIELLNW